MTARLGRLTMRLPPAFRWSVHRPDWLEHPILRGIVRGFGALPLQKFLPRVSLPAARELRSTISFVTLPLLCFGALAVTMAVVVVDALWPNWPTGPLAIDAPTIPVTVAGVVFDVPPAAIRAAVQRHPGAHERIDLAFVWPSLTPPEPDLKEGAKPEEFLKDDANAAASAGSARLFVTIDPLGNLLTPVERLRSIYVRYLGADAAAGRDGLAVAAFRAGTPYEGEDLVYVAGSPEQFFARCTRPAVTLPGTCIHTRAVDTAQMTMRFAREWLSDWRGVAAGFDKLAGTLHPAAK